MISWRSEVPTFSRSSAAGRREFGTVIPEVLLSVWRWYQTQKKSPGKQNMFNEKIILKLDLFYLPCSAESGEGRQIYFWDADCRLYDAETEEKMGNRNKAPKTNKDMKEKKTRAIMRSERNCTAYRRRLTGSFRTEQWANRSTSASRNSTIRQFCFLLLILLVGRSFKLRKSSAARSFLSTNWMCQSYIHLTQAQTEWSNVSCSL